MVYEVAVVYEAFIVQEAANVYDVPIVYVVTIGNAVIVVGVGWLGTCYNTVLQQFYLTAVSIARSSLLWATPQWLFQRSSITPPRVVRNDRPTPSGPSALSLALRSLNF